MSATTTARRPRLFPGIAFQMPDGGMTDEQFFKFCVINPELRVERTFDKYIIIMPPTNSETGSRNAELTVDLGIWNRKYRLGTIFDSSTGFKLPSGSERSPDAAWIRSDRWNALLPEQQKRFAPIAPDFVAEIRSGDQSMQSLKDKMDEYMDCGCQLGWLIDPSGRETWVYAENTEPQAIPFDETLSGGEVMPGFALRLADIF